MTQTFYCNPHHPKYSQRIHKHRTCAEVGCAEGVESVEVDRVTRWFCSCINVTRDHIPAWLEERTKYPVLGRGKAGERRVKHYQKIFDGDVEPRYCTKEEQKARKAKCDRAHRDENKDAIRAQKRKYYVKNKKAISAQHREYYEENKDATLAQQRKRRKHLREMKPEVLLEEDRKATCSHAALRTRAKRVGLMCMERAEYDALHTRTPDCQLCGAPKPSNRRHSISRVRNGGPFLLPNVIVACVDCGKFRSGGPGVRELVGVTHRMSAGPSAAVMDPGERRDALEAAEFRTPPFGPRWRECGTYEEYVRADKKRGWEFGLTREEFEELQLSPCAYCGRPGYEGDENGVDRVDSKQRHVPDNCITACATCNYFKGGMPVRDFYGRMISIALHTSRSGWTLDHGVTSTTEVDTTITTTTTLRIHSTPV